MQITFSARKSVMCLAIAPLLIAIGLARLEQYSRKQIDNNKPISTWHCGDWIYFAVAMIVGGSVYVLPFVL